MAQALEPDVAKEREIYFELDRFELTEAGRLELSGRWFGVRGRRFMRPTLTLLAGGGRRRLLADLDGKPWAAEDGTEWNADFSCELHGDRVTSVELSVAPDIAVELPPPGARARRVHAQAHRVLDRPAPARELERRDAERRETERLRAELEGVRVQSAAASARRNAAVEKLEQLENELGQAVAERDRATTERDRAHAERRRATDERDRAVDERDAATADQRRALAERQRALAERDAALAAAKSAEAQRDAALAAARSAEAQRDAALETARQAEEERRRALPPAEPATASIGRLRTELTNPVPPPRRIGWHERYVWRPSRPNWIVRVAAWAVLVAALVAFGLVTHII